MSDHAAKSLLDLYLYAAGTSEVPRAFHLWSALTIVSACVADRVLVPKFVWQPLRLNLYTMLVGPSGCGKGEAITFAQAFLSRLPRLAVHAGMVTAQGLYKHMAAGVDDTGADRSRLVLIAEETGMCIGEGQIARDFVKHITGLYKGSSAPISKSTAKDGTVTIPGYNLVALFGTTREWMIESIPKSAFEGGGLARICAIEAPYSRERHPRPRPPHDFEAAATLLMERFDRLCGLEGMMALSDEALALHDQWYMERPEPSDEVLWPTWRREDDLVWKLTGLIGLCEAPTLRVEKRHFIAAQRLAKVALASVPGLVRFASQTPLTASHEIVARRIEHAGTIQHSILQRNLSGRGIDRFALQAAIQTLREERRILVQPGNVYVWRRRPEAAMEDVPATEQEEEEEM